MADLLDEQLGVFNRSVNWNAGPAPVTSFLAQYPVNDIYIMNAMPAWGGVKVQLGVSTSDYSASVGLKADYSGVSPYFTDSVKGAANGPFGGLSYSATVSPTGDSGSFKYTGPSIALEAPGLSVAPTLSVSDNAQQVFAGLQFALGDMSGYNVRGEVSFGVSAGAPTGNSQDRAWVNIDPNTFSPLNTGTAFYGDGSTRGVVVTAGGSQTYNQPTDSTQLAMGQTFPDWYTRTSITSDGQGVFRNFINNAYDTLYVNYLGAPRLNDPANAPWQDPNTSLAPWPGNPVMPTIPDEYGNVNFAQTSAVPYLGETQWASSALDMSLQGLASAPASAPTIVAPTINGAGGPAYKDADGNLYATQELADQFQDAMQDMEETSEEPVVLDIAGNGINITPVSSSNTFMDVAGDGYKNLTAWAGAGNGVLFVDMTDAGQLTQANQMIFTDWDPSASSDMQALLDVFDTNHDGALDAGDADFSKFFVMVTNADGTQTAKSLVSLGVTSINLNANAVNQTLSDGSSIDGETTFTMTNPSTSVTTTQVAATVTLKADSDGHVVTSATTVNADGSTTVSNAVSGADGSLVFTRVLNTSSNGLSKTLTELNSGGGVMSLQTDNTLVNGGGSTTETITNYRGGAVQANGELTASGATGSEKLDSQAITTSGGTVTILRDQLGGGWTTQKEVDTTNADGSRSIVISNLNPDASASSVTTTNVSADGLTRTVTALVDNIAADSVVQSDVTQVNGSTRTETATTTVGTTITQRITTVTQTAANSVTRTTSSDLTDGTTLNLTTVETTTTNANGSTTTTQTDTAANGTLLDETLTQLSASGLLKTTSTDTTGALNAGAPVFDKVVADNTVVNGDGSRTETVTSSSTNGTTRAQSITTRAASGPARTVTVYGNGDGAVTQNETVAVNTTTGTVTETVTNLNADSSLNNETVTTTTADGLSKTVQSNTTGATSSGAPAFDHTTKNITSTAGGVSTETITDYGASTSNLIDVTQTVTSADGLTKTVSLDFTGALGVADGTWDQISVDHTVANADGSLTETVTLSDGAGHTLGQTVTATSADRRTVTTTSTLGTTGLVTQVEKVVTQSNGWVVDTSTKFDQNGDVLGAAVTTTSADGLTKIVSADIQGQSAAAYGSNGLVLDRTTTAATTINADGSRTTTTNVAAQNGALISASSVSTSPNGLTVTTIENPVATAHYATRTVDATTLNSDGSSTETVSDYNYAAGLVDQTTTTVSANHLSTTVLHDLNGDGVTDQSTTDVTTINGDGSRTEVVTDYTAGVNGTIRDVMTATSGIIVSGAGLKTTVTRQSYGSVPTYQVETITPSVNGTVTDTTQYYSQPGGFLLKTVATSTSANGLTKVVSTELNADTTSDFSTSDAIVLNADGGRTETVANYNKAGLVSETVTTVSANGLSKTTDIDANGALNGSAPVFNLVTTDTTVLNASDGSQTETVSNSAANGTTISQTVKTTSADQQKVTINRYLDETGTISAVDQHEVIQTQADGSKVDTVGTNGLTNNFLGTIVTTTSGNGLKKTTTYNNAAGAAVDTQSDTTTYDTSGDGGTLRDLEDTEFVNSSSTLTSSVQIQTSANGQRQATTMALGGALASTLASSFNDVVNTTVAIADTGNTTETTTDTINGAAAANDTTIVVTSANGLVITTSTALGSSAPYIQSVATTNLDGSKTEVTTYENPANLALIEEQATVNTSYDGRTVATTQQSDYDGAGYNVQTAQTVENADGTTTDTRAGTGSFGAGSFSTTTNVVTNTDGSQTTTTLNHNASAALIGQTVSIVSADGLVKSFAVDATGTESSASLNAAAVDLLKGAALPTTLLSSDILGVDTKTLNPDGSTTETSKSYFGSLANLRSQAITTTSADGLVTTRQIDSDGNGTFEQVVITTTAPDGSTTDVTHYYGNAGGNAGQLTASNTLTTSANGLVTVLSTSTGVTDTTTSFANANGSYQWARSVSGTASGLSSGSAAHDIDANSIDTWSWTDGSSGGTSGTITIDLATESQDVAAANMIYTTVLGHAMTDAETQYLGQYITNGVLNRTALATALVNSSEYGSDYRGVPLNPSGFTYQVYEDFLNVLGRLPTASEVSTFDPASMQTATITVQTLAQTAVAIAQYATDWTGGGVSVLAGAGQGLLASLAPQPIGAAQTYAIGYGGSGGSGFWAQLANAIFANGATINIPLGSSAVVDGTNDTIDTIGSNSAVTLDGSGDTINAGSGFFGNVNGGSDTVNFSGANDYVGLFGNGNADVVNGDVAGDNVGIVSNTTATINGTGGLIGIFGDNNTLTTSNESIYTMVNMTGENITGSGDTISAASGFSGNVNGGSDTVNFSGANDYVGLFGNGNTDVVNGDVAGDNVGLVSNTTATINGSGGSIGIFGTNDTLTTSNEAIYTMVNMTGENITGSGDTISAASGFSGNLYGGSDTITFSGTNDYVGLFGNGNTDVVNGDVAGDNVGLVSNTTATINGSGGSIGIFGTNDTLTTSNESIYTMVNMTGENITGSGDIISAANGFSGSVAGSSDTITLGTNDHVVLSGAGEVAYNDVASDSVSLGSNTAATVNGSGGTINLNGTGDTVTASHETIVVGTNESVTVSGSGDTILVDGSGDTIYASGDTIDVASGDTATIDGTSDNAEGSVSWTGVTTGDTDDGNSVSGGGGGGGGDPTDPPTDPNDPTDPGFAGNMSTVRATLSASVSAIAQFDLTPDNPSGAVQLKSSLTEINQRIANGDTSAALEGGKWTREAITWSLAQGNGSSFGSADSLYEVAAQAAFAEWGLATGLQFLEVSDPLEADIEIGAADLDTQASGLIGLTSYRVSNGQMQSGINIELEAPSRDALGTGPDGQVTYSGTDATLQQVLTHEIGHALGFADNADPDSIMYYYLSSNNRTLDATDIAGVEELYGQTAFEDDTGANGAAPAGGDRGAHFMRGGQLLASGAAVSDSALIGRGTGDLYTISSGFAGWKQGDSGADTTSIHHDLALFDSGNAFETVAPDTVATNVAITAASNGNPDNPRHGQAAVHAHMSG